MAVCGRKRGNNKNVENFSMIDPNFDSEDKCGKAEYLSSLWNTSIDMEKFKSEFVLSVSQNMAKL